MNKPLVAGIVIGCVAVVGGLITVGVIPWRFGTSSSFPEPASPAPDSSSDYVEIVPPPEATPEAPPAPSTAPEPPPTVYLPEDYYEDAYEILDAFYDAYELGVGQCSEATLLLSSGYSDAGFSLFETAANNQTSFTDMTILLWDEINPPSEFRSFHIRYANALDSHLEAFELVGYHSHNRDLQGLIDAIALMEGCAIEFDSCHSEFDRICADLGL